MSTIYYNHNHNHNNQNNKNHNLSRSMHFDLRKNKANKRQVIMNELLISNPDLLNNFHKRYSKTPGRLRMKNKTNVLHSTKYTNLLSNKNKNSRQDKLNKNLKKNNTTPISKHINQIQKEKKGNEKNKRKIDIKNKKSYSHYNANLKYKNNKNVLFRSESFSILEVKKNNNNDNIDDLNNKNKILEKIEKSKKNQELNNINKISLENREDQKNNENLDNNNLTPQINLNENICTPKNDNANIDAYDRINPKYAKCIKSSSKVNKKIFKIESLSQVGYSGPGVLKYNQDNFFIYKNLNDESNVLFIGVCDGHGLVGHDVSKYLISNLPKNLNTSLKKTNKYISHKETLYSTLKQVFIETNKSLCQNKSIDTKFSGSTCVTIILTKNKIISANAGDSRAVMGRYINGKWLSIELSHDQKPNNPGEKERILSHGGRIEAYKDENGADFGPPRVWLKYEDVPGLAMSRSFGDEIAASVGTISEPEIEEYEITEDDKFIILASDGIWEFISSQECVEFIKDFYEKKDLKGCLKFLLNESSKRWIKEEEVIDDITAVLIFFDE